LAKFDPKVSETWLVLAPWALPQYVETISMYCIKDWYRRLYTTQCCVDASIIQDKVLDAEALPVACTHMMIIIMMINLHYKGVLALASVVNYDCKCEATI
jgi:hypothetical protein